MATFFCSLVYDDFISIDLRSIYKSQYIKLLHIYFFSSCIVSIVTGSICQPHPFYKFLYTRFYFSMAFQSLEDVQDYTTHQFHILLIPAKIPLVTACNN